MAKDRISFAKRQREMERKRKADEKRQHRARRKQQAERPSGLERMPEAEQLAEPTDAPSTLSSTELSVLEIGRVSATS
jgi:sRNA-binding protein